MTPACSSLNTSWFTTSLIALSSHHWCSQDDLWSGSIKMRWMHKSGLIPLLTFISSITRNVGVPSNGARNAELVCLNVYRKIRKSMDIPL